MKKNKQILEIPSLTPGRKAYRIHFDKLESSPEYQILPKEAVKCFEELYVNIQEKPKKNIKSLKELFAKYPNVPEIANLLTYAYIRVKKRKEAERLIENTFLAHPNHLTARINYADQIIRLKKKASVPEILQIDTLLREKESFHYSEFRGLMIAMGFYHLSNEEREKAEEFYDLAFQVDPLHPSVAALEKKIAKESSGRLRLSKILKKCMQSLQNLACISKNP